MRRFQILCACAMLLLTAAPARAQFETAALVGTVRDTTGGIVADATITLLNPETGVSAKRTSGADGTFEFVTVKPGVYVVTAEKTGLSMAGLPRLRAMPTASAPTPG